MEITSLGTVASAAAWVWSNYGKEVSDAALKKIAEYAGQGTINLAKTSWAKFDWKHASTTYREEVTRLYGTTRVLGKPEPIPLDDIFTDVFILNEPTAFRRFDIATLSSDPSSLPDDENRTNGLRLIKRADSNRIFILGKPGAGKTTFLKYITLQAATGNLDKIPIFVSLKSLSDSEYGLMAFLDKQFEICGFPDAQPFVKQILNEGKAIVLFDGLDEVNEEESLRGKSIRAIRDFCDQYRKTQVLITCRLAATDYTFPNFKYVELADFTEKQVGIYVRHWFRDSPAKLRKFTAEFVKDDNKGLRELGKIPLLLGLLCLSFDATMSFPQRRVEIYEEALEALLKKWDSSRSIKRDEFYQGLSLGRKRQMFSRIAARTFKSGQYFISKDVLASHIVSYLQQLPNAPSAIDIDGEAVLGAIEAQHGIFSERANRIYSFSHLTFQEYFTAKHIVEESSGQELRDLLELKIINDTRWREVILLVASLLDDADLFFQLFMKSLSILLKDNAIQSILIWTNEKTTRIKSNIPIPLIRYIYLHKELSFIFPLNDYIFVNKLAISAVSESFAPSIEVRQAIQLALENPADQINSEEGHLIRDVATFCKRTLDRASFIAMHLGDDIAADWYLYNQLFLARRLSTFETGTPNERKAASNTHAIYNESLSELIEGYKKPKVLIKKSFVEKLRKQTSWVDISEYILRYMNAERNIGNLWPLNDKLLTVTSQYIAATRLMNDCLRLAIVSERKSIIDTYCIPPKLWNWGPELL